MVLGLEAVMPDGAVWNGLRRLRKDNTGYCLRQLMVGSEGTLGIITAAVLKLAPQAREREVALCSLPSVEAVLELFSRLQRHDPASLVAFEYMGAVGMALVLKHGAGVKLPVGPAAAYCLVELATPREQAGLRAGLEAVLERALEDGTVLDAAIAESEAQRAALWKLRRSIRRRRSGRVRPSRTTCPSRCPACRSCCGAARRRWRR